MNSVHEPGPNGDSETIPSRKTRSKTKPCARAQTLAHLGKQARACLAVSWALRPCRGLAARSCHGLHDRIAGASVPCRGRVRAQARPYRGLPCNTLPSLKLPFLSQYIVLYCNAIPAKPDCCNTIYCIAIQSTLCPPKATLS